MFKQRSYQKEFLDAEQIPSELLRQNLKELAFINTYLGGHQISINALKHLQPLLKNTKELTIVDIGSGGGDSLIAIHHWLEASKLKAQLIGVDLKPDCITYAKQQCQKLKQITLLCDDFRNVFLHHKKIDIVHASLFCHHFLEAEIIGFIKLCRVNGSIFIINDLERNPIAYYAIKWLTFFFSKSPLVKHDAPLSVWRGFKKKEWQAMLVAADVKNYTIKNKWAFRHQLIIYPH
jgi:2-polyprenyl-3-methyl-5-hydroxy-6-metoxy-1,4-benzoquinol methylase